ncbi:MAG: S46 family peptidase, partial [Bacteroidetes bacterium]|nr:S46 family peptidase [Bacteroidota bacterium]
MDRRLSSISVAFILPQLLAIFIGACAPPRMIVEVTERPEPSENIIVETPLTSDPADVTSDPFAGVEVGRFDGGKMWTFDNPPVDYFEDTYDFRPDSSWFARAMLGALRFSTYCSASFVSPSGLILTNHHCARSSVTDVSRPGENLLDNGFYADSLSAERRVADLYVEQLLRIQDVTSEVYAAAANVLGAGPKAEARRKRADAIKNRLESMALAEDSTMKVEVIALYHGGIYAAYTFKRYNDIRLVMAPELQIGFFGGDFDNFTFPRFNLDMSLFRAYGEDGEPLNTPDYYRWNTEGSSVGEAVFVVGNPGSTSRLSTVSQLEYYRDYSLPQSIEVLEDRSAILERYLSRHREESERFDIRNDYFSLRNELKSQTG